MRRKTLIGSVLYIATIALAGCGVGAGTGVSETSTAPDSETSSTVIAGVASKGPIDAGTVKVYAIRSDAVDPSPIGQGATDANGNYTVEVGGYKGPVMVEVAGGSFKDEVSGEKVTLISPLRAVFANVSTGKQKVAVTPLTELASRRAKGHAAITADVINESNKSVATTFNLPDIISTQPVADGTDDQKRYAASCGTFSQLANDRQKSTGGSLDDALKGVMDDMGNEAEHSGLSNDTITKITVAETEFNGGGKNQTGVAAPMLTPVNGILKISTSGGAKIGVLDMTIILPAGVEVAADPATGEAAEGAVAISGVAATGKNEHVTAKVLPASGENPAKLTISMTNGAGFGAGECITVDFHVAAGTSIPAKADAFTVADVISKGIDGKTLSNVTVGPQSVGAL